MLQVGDLYCERARRVLFENLSFTVAPGELLQIEGANGSGKTTLLKILSGLYQDYSGDVDWRLNAWPLFVGHKPGVKDHLTARENLKWLVDLYQPGTQTGTIDDAIVAVGLRGFEDVLCGAMSEGQRKRVNLARLFLLTSPAWLLDEPLSAIDVDGVKLLQERIALQLNEGGIVILASHQLLDVDHEVHHLNLSAPS